MIGRVGFRGKRVGRGGQGSGGNGREWSRSGVGRVEEEWKGRKGVCRRYKEEWKERIPCGALGGWLDLRGAKELSSRACVIHFQLDLIHPPPPTIHTHTQRGRDSMGTSKRRRRTRESCQWRRPAASLLLLFSILPFASPFTFPAPPPRVRQPPTHRPPTSLQAAGGGGGGGGGGGEGNAPYLRFAADAPGVLQHLQPAVAALV